MLSFQSQGTSKRTNYNKTEKNSMSIEKMDFHEITGNQELNCLFHQAQINS